MKSAIIQHGLPSKDEYYDLSLPSESNSHWLPWLQKQLMAQDYKVDTPEVPHAYALNYADWQKEFERFEVNGDTSLVGHSCGGGFIIRWLSDHSEIKVGRVVLVAPWLNPNKERNEDFFDFTIDSKLAERTESITIFHSTNDDATINTSVNMLREQISGIEYVEFQNYGHFCFMHMKTEEFPELLEAVTR